MSDVLNTVANNIKKYRHNASLSQEELADLSRLHRTYIGMLERCEKNVTIKSLEKIANALHTPISNLLKEENEK